MVVVRVELISSTVTRRPGREVQNRFSFGGSSPPPKRCRKIKIKTFETEIIKNVRRNLLVQVLVPTGTRFAPFIRSH